MVQYLQCWITYLAILILLPAIQCNPFWWPYWPINNQGSAANATPTTSGSSAPSNVVISIGNRVNTTAGLDDYGTTISGLTINLTRWNSSLVLVQNGTELQITRCCNVTTIIRVGVTVPNNATNSTLIRTDPGLVVPTELSPGSRKKRDITIPGIPGVPSISSILPSSSIPSIPSIPIPTINGSFISLNGNTIPLPTSISNLTINAIANSLPSTNVASTIADFSNPINALQQPWQFLKLLTERRFFPIRVLDPMVTFLSAQYDSTGKTIINGGVAALNHTLTFASTVVNSALDYATAQVSLGLETAARVYNGLTNAAQTCVGEFPEDSGRQVVATATGCVRERWDELVAIVDQFRAIITNTDADFSAWLQQLSKCNVRYFGNVSGSEQETAQRRCYVQAIANSASRKLVDVPIRWANLTLRISNTVTNFQPQVALCIANVGAEVAAISTNVAIRTALCQLIP